jgi:hypothetical protein
MHPFTAKNRILVALAVFGLALGAAPRAQAQTPEAEPNNACITPQNLAGTALPVTIAGSLDTPPAVADVDFYRFTATPGDLVTITLERTAATLDPYLGVFAADCATLIALDDDGGGNLNSRTAITVPEDGTFVVAASSYVDSSFTGAGSSAGPYRLTVDAEAVVESIGGRVVSAATGTALANASVLLFHCSDTACDGFLGSVYTDADGRFLFSSADPFTPLLPAGEYNVTTEPSGYQLTETGRFAAAGGQALDLGDLPVRPLPVVGSISGRVADLQTGAPLSGTATPFAWVDLRYCPEGWYCYFVRSARPDAQGAFRFVGTENDPLRAGTYQVSVRADQYQGTETATFAVGDGQDYDAGTISLKSFPIRVHLVQECTVPSAGGTCAFTLRVGNGMANKLEGDAWNLVTAVYTGAATGFTSFQTGNPKAFNLQPGRTADLAFTFAVPATVDDGAFLCTQTFAARKGNAFDALGNYFLFCLTKGADGGFTVVPEKQKNEVLKRAQGLGAQP